MLKRFVLVLVCAGLIIMPVGFAVAQEKYPSKPITSIIPFPAGGSTDVMGRALEKAIRQHLGQPLVTVNKGGGGGAIGIYEVVKSNPDGYTIVSTGASPAMPELYTHFREAPFKSTDLAPVAQWAYNIVCVAVRSDSPWKDLKSFMADAQKKEYKFGGPGPTATNYTTGLALAVKYKAKLVGVPSAGDKDSILALLGGHIDMITPIIGSIKPHISAGTIRLLGIIYDRRLAEFPDVPTLSEAGFDVGMLSTPVGTYVKTGTPPDRIKILSEAIKKATEDESFKATMRTFEMPVRYADAEGFAKARAETKQTITEIYKILGYLPK